MQRGIRSNARHGKNYIQKEANSRMDEIVKPAKEQQLNALGVDSFETFVFRSMLSTTVCTCKETPQYRPQETVSTDVPINIRSQEVEIRISGGARPLFGEPADFNSMGDNDPNSEFDLDDVDDQREFAVTTSVIESDADCGICYRTGFVPGYELFGHERKVYTTHDIADMLSSTVNVATMPHSIERVHHSGWVSFVIDVPKYFKTCTYSIRNNHEILNDKIYVGTAYLTLADLKANAGKQMTVRIQSNTFTHFVLDFDLGTIPVKANLAQMSKVVDWTLFETAGNIGIVLPSYIGELPVGTALIVPSRNAAFKVSDVQYLKLANGSVMDWQCTTRFLQPQEKIRHILKGFRVI